ncbi:hypothetical protein ALC57_04779 [Trachymyrmex cornetzi]|uniref:Uncharacterized protein n=1 Tax=Trachymyrmex cornetzi TaxID=471704 RepID=A0A195ED12_9HYME|nr:hypothetical protein ALC57_04779 [Trachymyrmex cornetzi]
MERESAGIVIGNDRERKSDTPLYEKIDEARLDRSVADERLKLFRLVMCGHVSNNASLIDHNCHEDLSPERFGSPSRQKKTVNINVLLLDSHCIRCASYDALQPIRKQDSDDTKQNPSESCFLIGCKVSTHIGCSVNPAYPLAFNE